MATETAEHASGGSFPPFEQLGDFGISQVFWLVVTFAVLYFAVATVFLPKIRKSVEDRDGAIKKDVAEAAALSAKADESVKQFEAQIAAARANARDTAAKAKAESDARTSAASAKIEAELNSRLAAAEARITETRTKAMANVSVVAEDAAAAIAERLTGAKPSADTVKKAVASAMGA